MTMMIHYKLKKLLLCVVEGNTQLIPPALLYQPVLGGDTLLLLYMILYLEPMTKCVENLCLRCE